MRCLVCLHVLSGNLICVSCHQADLKQPVKGWWCSVAGKVSRSCHLPCIADSLVYPLNGLMLWLWDEHFTYAVKVHSTVGCLCRGGVDMLVLACALNELTYHTLCGCTALWSNMAGDAPWCWDGFPHTYNLLLSVSCCCRRVGAGVCIEWADVSHAPWTHCSLVFTAACQSWPAARLSAVRSNCCHSLTWTSSCRNASLNQLLIMFQHFVPADFSLMRL